MEAIINDFPDEAKLLAILVDDANMNAMDQLYSFRQWDSNKTALVYASEKGLREDFAVVVVLLKARGALTPADMKPAW